MTAQECLEHPWVKYAGETTNEQSVSSLRSQSESSNTTVNDNNDNVQVDQCKDTSVPASDLSDGDDLDPVLTFEDRLVENMSQDSLSSLENMVDAGVSERLQNEQVVLVTADNCVSTNKNLQCKYLVKEGSTSSTLNGSIVSIGNEHVILSEHLHMCPRSVPDIDTDLCESPSYSSKPITCDESESPSYSSKSITCDDSDTHSTEGQHRVCKLLVLQQPTSESDSDQSRIEIIPTKTDDDLCNSSPDIDLESPCINTMITSNCIS